MRELTTRERTGRRRALLNAVCARVCYAVGPDSRPAPTAVLLAHLGLVGIRRVAVGALHACVNYALALICELRGLWVMRNED